MRSSNQRRCSARGSSRKASSSCSRASRKRARSGDGGAADERADGQRVERAPTPPPKSQAKRPPPRLEDVLVFVRFNVSAPSDGADGTCAQDE